MAYSEELVRVVAEAITGAEDGQLDWDAKARAALDAVEASEKAVLVDNRAMVVFSTQGQVTLEGKPFVATFLNEFQFGQLEPGEAQALGLRVIQAGIEAERDSGLIRYFQSAGFDNEQVGAVLTHMREHRDQFDPQEGQGN